MPEPIGPNVHIYLGSFDSGVYGDFVSAKREYSAAVKIPWQFNDFRNANPYTSLLLYLPAYGIVELNPNDYINNYTVHIRLMIEGSTGRGTYYVDDVFKGECDFGTDQMIGTIASNAVGYTSSLVSTGLSLLGGGKINNVGEATRAVSGAVGGVFNAYLAGKERFLGSVGSVGGLSSVFSSIQESAWYEAVVILITHDTTIEPSSVAETIGRPSNQMLKLSNCTGYVQTVNASVNCVNSQIADQINGLLNGGVYIE